MKPLFLSLICLISLLGFGQSKPEKSTKQQERTLTIATDLVSLPVTVTDVHGRYIANLQKADFTVYEDGVKQLVEHFSSHETPFSVVLLLDTSGSTRSHLQKIQAAARAFFEQIGEDDSVLPMAFDNEISPLIESFSRDKAQLNQALERLHTNSGGYQRHPPNLQPGSKRVIYANTRLHDAILVAFDKLRLAEGRKALILFSDGGDNASRATDRETLRAAAESDALVYTVQYGGDEASPQERAKYYAGRADGGAENGFDDTSFWVKKYMENLATVSGGRHFIAKESLSMTESFRQIADELSRNYSIGYYPTSPHSGMHKIKVAVVTNQASTSKVRTRSYYVK